MRSNQDYSYYFDGRLVHCLLCNSIATVKPTRTKKLMLRCDNCRLLVFANAQESQWKLSMLPDY